jgi:hypothetical protein
LEHLLFEAVRKSLLDWHYGITLILA